MEANKQAGENKAKKGNKAKLTGLLLLIIILAAGGLWLYFYAYENLHYLTTENAKVSAKTVSVYPPKAGEIKDWYVFEGDYVRQDQLLGRQSDLSRIKAPMEGAVVKTTANRNQLVSAATELAIIADVDNMYIQANIEETNLPQIREGQEVDIQIDAYGSRKFTGYVYEINMTTQQAFSSSYGLNTSGTYTKTTQLIPVKISIVNEEGLPLTIGMNAFVRIRVRE